MHWEAIFDYTGMNYNMPGIRIQNFGDVEF